MPPLIAAAVIAGVGTAVSAKVQSDAAKKASRRQGKAADRQIALQEEQFDLFRPLIEGGIAEFNRAREIADFDPVQRAGVRFREASRLLNADLARTGNLRSGGGSDLLRRSAERIFAEEQQQVFANRASLASLGASQGNAGFQGANSLFGGINNSINAQNAAQLQQAGVVGGAIQGIAGLPLQVASGGLGGGLFGQQTAVTQAQGSPGSSIGLLERGAFGRR